MTENSFTELALSWTGTPVQQSGKVHRCYLLPKEGGQSAPNLAAAVTAELLLQQGRALTAGALSASPCLAATIGTAECDAVVAKITKWSSCYSSGELLQQRRAVSSSSGLLQAILKPSPCSPSSSASLPPRRKARSPNPRLTTVASSASCVWSPSYPSLLFRAPPLAQWTFCNRQYLNSLYNYHGDSGR